MKKHRHFTILMVLMSLNYSFGQLKKTSSDVFLGVGISTIKTQVIEINPYYYDFLSVASFEAGIRENFRFNKFISAKGEIGYARNGFEGRHFIRVQTDTIFQSQEESWSKFHFDNLLLSAGLSVNVKKIIAIDASIRSFLKIRGVEKYKTVELSNFYAQNFIGKSQKKQATDFKNFNWGFDFGVQHWLTNRISVDIRGYFARTRLKSVPKFEYRLESRGIQFRTLFTIF